MSSKYSPVLCSDTSIKILIKFSSIFYFLLWLIGFLFSWKKLSPPFLLGNLNGRRNVHLPWRPFTVKGIRSIVALFLASSISMVLLCVWIFFLPDNDKTGFTFANCTAIKVSILWLTFMATGSSFRSTRTWLHYILRANDKSPLHTFSPL